ncbi:c-type cytochrome biogenesis protein CcsB [Pseudoclavibacter sp. AY1F1]|uniref:c-type cytochrome biogenesis protein CcsB n=1 Tax=Pseudoclavibacter sp. AY1F1 TaxID=2080583 RepID=UPI000CE8745A|nr:c-type cytochrome biogenesis protein CcsB [Pseudoclavibacter sp. AY1F1]PPF42881.1 c-type cytochrome biogenesis protein CcsB [Pseudoclavibacter sp. AY1F1]
MIETLSSWSNLLLYISMAVYSVAFIAFAMDLAGRSARAAERSQRQSAVGATAARRGALVGAGAAASASVDNEEARARELSEPASYTVEDPSSSVSLASTRTESGDAWRDTRATPSLRIAMWLTIAAFVVQLAATTLRGIAAERVPWSNMFEFSMTSTLLIVLVFLLARFWADVRFLGTFITGFTVITLGIATLGFYVDVVPLAPALQSVWLVIHVFVASLATGCLAIGAGLSVAQLLQTRRVARVRAGLPTKLNMLSALPDAVRLENLAYRINIVGFILWTFTLMAGAVWAERAWGRYWGWDTKEVWTFIIWVVYAGYIHARATRGWRGTPSAWLAVAGFATVMFNFGIVNVFFKGLHAYSGL